MAKFSTNFSEINKASKITIFHKDGTITNTTYGEVIKARKKSAPKAKKAKRPQSQYAFNAEVIKSAIKHFKVLKSVESYYHNGYKQWGVIFKQNINDNRSLDASFNAYALKYHEVEQQLQLIQSEKNSDQFGHIEKLTYLMDDLTKELQSIMKIAENSPLMKIFSDHEMINGEGRRLGLQTIVIKAYLSLNEIDKTLKSIAKIAIDGRDAFDYSLNERSCGRY